MSYIQFRLADHRLAVLVCALALSAALALQPNSARADTNLVEPSRVIDPSQPFRLSLLVTAEDDARDYSLPELLRVNLTADLGAPTRIELRRASAVADQITLGPGEFLRVDYVGTVPANMRGRVRVDALDLDAPAMLVRLSTPRVAAEPELLMTGGDDAAKQVEQLVAPAPANVLAVRADKDPNLQLDARISAFEPMFFAAGYGSDANAHLQLIFKLRLHEPVDKTSRDFHWTL